MCAILVYFLQWFLSELFCWGSTYWYLWYIHLYWSVYPQNNLPIWFGLSKQKTLFLVKGKIAAQLHRVKEAGWGLTALVCSLLCDAKHCH